MWILAFDTSRENMKKQISIQFKKDGLKSRKLYFPIMSEIKIKNIVFEIPKERDFIIDIPIIHEPTISSMMGLFIFITEDTRIDLRKPYRKPFAKIELKGCNITGAVGWEVFFYNKNQMKHRYYKIEQVEDIVKDIEKVM